jgi:hypothetical protein
VWTEGERDNLCNDGIPDSLMWCDVGIKRLCASFYQMSAIVCI